MKKYIRLLLGKGLKDEEFDLLQSDIAQSEVHVLQKAYKKLFFCSKQQRLELCGTIARLIKRCGMFLHREDDRKTISKFIANSKCFSEELIAELFISGKILQKVDFDDPEVRYVLVPMVQYRYKLLNDHINKGTIPFTGTALIKKVKNTYFKCPKVA